MKAFLALCVFLGFQSSSPSFASLGDTSSSIDSEAKNLSAKHASFQAGNYSVHVLTLATTVIKEYVTSQGMVFAVTWKGIKKPNLESILGKHYSEYAEAKSRQVAAKGRHANSVITNRLRVHSGGHMRALHGVAFLPDAVPPGVDPENLD